MRQKTISIFISNRIFIFIPDNSGARELRKIVILKLLGHRPGYQISCKNGIQFNENNNIRDPQQQRSETFLPDSESY
jgi:hypothetical protein